MGTISGSCSTVSISSTNFEAMTHDISVLLVSVEELVEQEGPHGQA